MTELDRYLTSLKRRISVFQRKFGFSKSSFGEAVSNDKLLNSLESEGIRLCSVRNIEDLLSSGPVTSPGGEAAQPQQTKPSCGHKTVKPALAPDHVRTGKGGERCKSKKGGAK